MANFERPLIEVARTGPEPIGARAIAGAIDPMAPDALGKVHPLPRFDHLGRRFGSQISLFESFREPALSKDYSGIAGNQNNSEGGCGNGTGLPSDTVHHIGPHLIHPGWQ
jgi:hypothetical protein